MPSGNFNPDFVTELKGGRILMMEYKGAHLHEYEQEKHNVGELWEEKGQGKVLFLWAIEHDSQSRDVYRQLENKLY